MYDITTLMYAYKNTRVLFDILNMQGNYDAADEVEILLHKYEAEIEKYDVDALENVRVN